MTNKHVNLNDVCEQSEVLEWTERQLMKIYFSTQVLSEILLLPHPATSKDDKFSHFKQSDICEWEGLKLMKMFSEEGCECGTKVLEN